MVTSPRPAATPAQPLPTAATLAADCVALMAELRSVQARLQLMDVENGVFVDPNPPPVGTANRQGQSRGKGKKKAANNDFIMELATRFKNIDDRLDQTARRVRALVSGGFIVSGFPSGQSKLPSP